MVSIRSFFLTTTCVFATQEQIYADTCGPAYHAEVAAAVQTLHANCASWSAYLANGGVWNCDSTCHDAVSNLVNTLPDCTFGGPYGQNYKDVVEGMVERCNNELPDSGDTTTATSSGGTLRTATSSASPQSMSASIVLVASAMFVVGVLQL